MAHGFTAMHVTHKKSHQKRAETVPASCYTGGFYTSPATSSTIAIDPSKTVKLSWDPACLPSTTAIDIYLYAPSSTRASPCIHEWANVPFSEGSYEAQFNPFWWNSTSSVQLQLGIVNSGDAPFDSRFLAGPVFTATYNEAASSAAPGKSPEVVAAAKEELYKGRTAAAVLIPLLVVTALGVWWWFRTKRAKVAEKSKRFSTALDKRMSTISTDWKSMSGAGANAAIRHSMAASGNRNSSFSFGGIRPSIDGNVENTAGVGSAASGQLDYSSTRQMSQIRPVIPGVGIGANERISRVSFAADAHPRSSISNNRLSSAASVAGAGRPSMDSTLSSMRKSRAFHNAYIPPVPALTQSYSGGSNKSPNLPEDSSYFSIGEAEKDVVQKLGAQSLTDGDIAARVSGEMSPNPIQSAGINGYTYEQYDEYADLTSPTAAALGSASVSGGYHGYADDVVGGAYNTGYDEDVSGALRMMRTTSDPMDTDNYLLPSEPAPTHAPAFEQYAYANQTQTQSGSAPTTSQSSASPNMAMPAVPASYMSPDEMLKAYASARAAGNANKFGVSTPSQIPSYPASTYATSTPIHSPKNPFSSGTSSRASSRGATPAMESNGGMRTLYTQTPPVAAGAFAPTSHRVSVASRKSSVSSTSSSSHRSGAGGRKKSLTSGKKGRVVSEAQTLGSRYSVDSDEFGRAQ